MRRICKVIIPKLREISDGTKDKKTRTILDEVIADLESECAELGWAPYSKSKSYKEEQRIRKVLKSKGIDLEDDY